MSAAWATAVIRLQQAEGGSPAEAAGASAQRRLLVRVQLVVGDEPSRVLGPVVAGRDELGALVASVLDACWDALAGPPESPADVDPTQGKDHGGGSDRNRG